MRSMRNARAFAAILLAALAPMAGCRDAATDDHDHEPVVLQMTAWSSQHEIYIEHPPLVAGKTADLLAYVTDLVDARPVPDGSLAYRWTHFQGQIVEIEDPGPARPGVFVTATTLPEPGLWRLEIRVPGAGDPLLMPEVRVYGNAHAAEHAEAGFESEAVVLLKEQQWRFGVASVPVSADPFTRTVEIAATVEASPDRRAVVSTPVAGRLAPAGGRPLAAPGTRVDAGDILGAIRAPTAGDGGDLAAADAALVRARQALVLAEAEVERARALHAAEAAPARRVQEAEAALSGARADHESAMRLSDANHGGDTAPELPLRSPLAGLVVKTAAAVGEYVAEGGPVFTVLDPSTLWIRGWIPENALPDLPPAPGALLLATDAGTPPRDLPPDRLVYMSPEVDARSRTASIVYEIDNADGALRIGQSLGLMLQTTRTEVALTVPASALVDEQGRPVVFVQTGGEIFAKRPVVLGGDDGRRYEVLSGLAAGDRVVVAAAWIVKLASADDAVPAHGHTH
ncbi:efflux RND transporter periplasmic adaptor subunit [bacterium]|nr:efflux RND transporter periplasmic adaptor subunit [bacterium]